jgi:hypothetical protein
MIRIPKRLAATGTLAGAVGDEVFDAVGAEGVPAQLHGGVADVAVADGADGDFLFHTHKSVY